MAASCVLAAAPRRGVFCVGLLPVLLSQNHVYDASGDAGVFCRHPVKPVGRQCAQLPGALERGRQAEKAARFCFEPFKPGAVLRDLEGVSIGGAGICAAPVAGDAPIRKLDQFG